MDNVHFMLKWSSLENIKMLISENLGNGHVIP
jgi:hypothetical protein